MSRPQTIVVSLVIGLLLTTASLLISRGTPPPMLPCAGVSPGCVPGVVLYPPPPHVDISTGISGLRGYPFTMLYLQQRGEYGTSTYEGYSWGGITGNIVIYTAIAVVVVNLVGYVRSRATQLH